MDGSVVKDNAHVSGALILGNLVIFEGHAQCCIKPQVRHPVYIGYPMLNFPTLIIQNGHRTEPDYGNVSKIKCSTHPIVNRAQIRKGIITTLIYTDDLVIQTKIKRGYERIADYKNFNSRSTSPTGKESTSWDVMHHDVRIAEKEKSLIGQFPQIDDPTILSLCMSEDLSRTTKPGPRWMEKGENAGLDMRW